MKTMMMAALVALPMMAFAQQKPPVAQYWMSVETSAGMNIPGMGGMAGMMAGMMGGQQQQSGRKLNLHLGSQRPADAPTAAHEIPAGMNMGPSLPLLSPRQAEARQYSGRDPYQSQERPKGRMLIFWGCGETTRPGQPVIVDFSNLGQGQMPAGFVSRNVARGYPAQGRTNGEWPNPQDSKAVPDSASLAGDHTIRGNYTPDIRFALGAGQDFMERIELSPSRTGGGAAAVRWNAPSTATGYFATTMGGDGNDVVFWSSSEVQESGAQLMDYVPPGEVARLIREKVVMPPQTTNCSVPAEVVKRSGGSAMMNFIAYGPEANFAQPPRPADPQWAVKVRFKSTAMTLLGEAGESGGRQQRADSSRAPAGDASAQPSAPAAPDPVKDGINILRGIFGR
jgi:hypothetical protein